VRRKIVSEARTRSNWWYLVPIIFDGIPGGVVAYFAIKYDDPRKAKNCLYLGIIITAIGVAGYLIIFVVMSESMPGMFNKN
jgi:Na+-driven multidrug efflux pump